jgi:hypothetical protein
MSGFQMPPAIAGDSDEVTPDADGAWNVARVAGGLTITGVVVAVGAYGAQRILALAGADEQGVSLSIN